MTVILSQNLAIKYEVSRLLAKLFKAKLVVVNSFTRNIVVCYDETSAQLVFNWKTSTSIKGCCRKMHLNLAELLVYLAKFNLPLTKKLHYRVGRFTDPVFHSMYYKINQYLHSATD